MISLPTRTRPIQPVQRAPKCGPICVATQITESGGIPMIVLPGLARAVLSRKEAEGIRDEIDRMLKFTSDCSTIQEMRSKLDGIYCGEGMPYPFSYANEVVTKGVCIFSMVKGGTKDAILAGVNMGRDTDCVAAVAAGISGALTGGSSIPASWIEKVDHATSVNPYTNSKRTLQESSDVLYDAYVRRLDRLESYAGAMRY